MFVSWQWAYMPQYYTVLCETLIIGSVFLQLPFTYEVDSSGPSTLPCGTADVTLISSDNCPPTLTGQQGVPLSTQLSLSPPPTPQFL
jgi:hypothetical protein